MVLERIVVHVLPKGHLVLERRVAPLQLEVVLDHLRKHRRSVDRHEILLL